MRNHNEHEGFYVSPFEIFKRNPDLEFIKWAPILGYKGSLQEVLIDLEGALQEADAEVARFLIAVHPPRVIRATIDYKIDHPELLRAEEYVREAIRYRDNLLFIALGHGGVASGMDVYNYYSDLTNNSNSEFYVIRASHLKMRDFSPRISESEKKYLSEKANERQIIIYDEDRIMRTTLNTAVDYFQKEVFPRRFIISGCNLQLPPMEINIFTLTDGVLKSLDSP